MDLTVRAKFSTLGGGKDPYSLCDRMPVAVDDLLTFLVGMVLSRPVQQQMAYQLVISAQTVCRDEPVVVGGPSTNDGIEFGNDLGLRGRSQLLQPLFDDDQVVMTGFCTGRDDCLAGERLFRLTFLRRIVPDGIA